ncbi:hypothetical protein ALI22I_42855 [Saccharothrix sp. ALI-22-I]|nr:hypothetical protein ALI22I_42855 [Saccharothrix sp. ALI-22-I]
MHWRELPLALPHDDTEMVFSGSVVVDHGNTSGFGTPEDPAMVAIYTTHSKLDGRQAQSLAYSTDNGHTWTKYAGNPVLDIASREFRDPKVQWQAGRWLMTVALSTEHQVRFYSSPDLKTWTHLSDFGPRGAVGGVWECPDLFPLQVGGDPAIPSGCWWSASTPAASRAVRRRSTSSATSTAPASPPTTTATPRPPASSRTSSRPTAAGPPPAAPSAPHQPPAHCRDSSP